MRTTASGNAVACTVGSTGTRLVEYNPPVGGSTLVSLPAFLPARIAPDEVKNSTFTLNEKTIIMKRTIFTALVAIATFAACQKSEVLIEDNQYLTAEIEQMAQTKTYMDDNNNIRWSEGDQVVAFMKSSYGHKYQLISSFAGKTYADFEPVSSGNGGNLSAGTEWDHNIVYYPYSDAVEAEKSGSNYALNIVLPSEQTYAQESFGNGSMAMVAVSEGNNITFKNVLGGMKLQLKGTQKVTSIKLEGKNSEKLSGAAIVTAYTDETKPAISMASGASTSLTLNCGSGVQLNESTATEFIISLPPVLFSNGFTVTVTDSDSQTYTVETDKANTVLRSSLLVMPAVVLKEEIVEEENPGSDGTLVEAISLNRTSLTLAPGTSYTLTAKVVPTDATDKTLAWSSDAAAIATVDQNGVVTAVSDGSAVITAVALGGVSESCTVTVITPPTSQATADYVDEYGVNHGKGISIGATVWAPVNCGYKSASDTDKGYPYGKLYQWGRKYGQGYSTSYDADEPTVEEGPVSLKYGQAEDNSNVFFTSSSDFGYDWLSTQDDKLWNSGTESAPIKTEYDPCPDGWRVPTYAELNILKNSKSSWTTNDGQKGYWFSGASDIKYDVPVDEDAKVFFPAAGYRRNGDGGARGRGSLGYYWSSRPNHNYAYYLYFGSSYADMGSDYRAYGYSVRCVQE